MAQPIPLRHAQDLLKASCHQCSLSNLCLPLAVGEGDLARLEDIVYQGRVYNRGDHIFEQSDRARSCFAVKSGAVRTSIVNENGDEQVTGFFLPGELVGLESLSGGDYACTARALERTSLCEFPVDKLEQLSGALPDLQHHMFHLMGQEIQTGHQMAMLLSRNTAEQRIAALLLSLSSRFQRRRLSPTRLTLPMPRSDIASFLGLAVETVSRVFTRFQKQGLIHAQGRQVELLDLPALQAVYRDNGEDAPRCQQHHSQG
ncbi:helix-turn-helix domain-containing protein [Marinobacter sp. C2H3]|uniref:helix-turn-helix domain-containing protein n=1 Tax=Marinobacter sp. C2H3 TaxID=3119003 RepID=UPI00300F0BA5